MTSSQYNVLKSNDLTESAHQLFLAPTLEFLIVCDQLKNEGYTTKEHGTLCAVLDEKEDAKFRSGLYSISSNIYQKHARERIAPTGSALRAGEYGTSSSVNTPKGSTVSTIYNRTPELTVAEMNSHNALISNNYPNALRLANPTVKYNCHSYAWYNQSTSNLHWMNDPSKYMTDGSYTNVSSAAANRKIFYNNGNTGELGNHSGIVSSVSGSAITVKSKWGQAGLYSHSAYDSPYSGDRTIYTFWR